MPSARGRRRALIVTLSLLAAVVGCHDAPAPPLTGAPVLLVAPATADETTERTLTTVSGYLETLSGAAPQVARLEGTGLDAIVDASARAGAAVAIVLEAETLAPERFDAARLAALGDDGFALDVADEGAHRNVLGDTGTTVVLAAATSRLTR